MLYRIYTEDKPNLSELASVVLGGYTIYHGIGYWDGTVEPCAVIEVIADSLSMWETVMQLAQTIKAVNRQAKVLVTQQELWTTWEV